MLVQKDLLRTFQRSANRLLGCEWGRARPGTWRGGSRFSYVVEHLGDEFRLSMTPTFCFTLL